MKKAIGLLLVLALVMGLSTVGMTASKTASLNITAKIEPYAQVTVMGTGGITMTYVGGAGNPVTAPGKIRARYNCPVEMHVTIGQLAEGIGYSLAFAGPGILGGRTVTTGTPRENFYSALGQIGEFFYDVTATPLIVGDWWQYAANVHTGNAVFTISYPVVEPGH
ncbi:MAG: hypothetical protein GX977_01430 [Firmicutes bacterium]|nr:hypothetical protein [Bacillota bacterium]